MIQRLTQALVDFVYPKKCCLCSCIGDALCPDCRNGLPQDKLQISLILPFEIVTEVHSLFPFDGVAADLVKALKYGRTTAAADPMAKYLADHWHADVSLACDAIIPVPLHTSRLNSRGYNQSALLSDQLPDQLRRDEWLRRTRATPPQVELSRVERLTNLKGAFLADPEVKGKVILLIDDVRTSGGTVNACAEALKKADAAEVKVLTFCGNHEDPDSWAVSF